MSTEVDMAGLLRAFADHERGEKEYILDTEAGTVHFVPVSMLRAGEEGTLEPDTLDGQERERAMIVLKYLDDIAGRYDLVPFVDVEAEGDWRQDFLEERGLAEIGPEDAFDWNTFKAARLREEVEAWLEDTGMFDEGEEE